MPEEYFHYASEDGSSGGMGTGENRYAVNTSLWSI